MSIMTLSRTRPQGRGLLLNQQMSVFFFISSVRSQQRSIMTRAALNFSIAFFLLLSRCCDANRKLLVFLIDGFRYDYMDDLQNLAGFREIVENGVKVDYLTPDFPSLSYPNYYSLMTGESEQLFISFFKRI